MIEGSETEDLEPTSPKRTSRGGFRFGDWKPSDLQDKDLSQNEESESIHSRSDVSEDGYQDQEGREDVNKLTTEVEALRLQIQTLEEKKKAHEEREQKRVKLYAEFLRWAPKVQQDGWLTNKVRKAYAACQKIVEELDREG